jgi:hypothetical protein
LQLLLLLRLHRPLLLRLRLLQLMAMHLLR